jgi:hypothetical protein
LYTTYVLNQLTAAAATDSAHSTPRKIECLDRISYGSSSSSDGVDMAGV